MAAFFTYNIASHAQKDSAEICETGLEVGRFATRMPLGMKTPAIFQA